MSGVVKLAGVPVPPLTRFFRAALYGATVFISFFLMLIFMTYNVRLFSSPHIRLELMFALCAPGLPYCRSRHRRFARPLHLWRNAQPRCYPWLRRRQGYGVPLNKPPSFIFVIYIDLYLNSSLVRSPDSTQLSSLVVVPLQQYPIKWYALTFLCSLPRRNPTNTKQCRL